MTERDYLKLWSGGVVRAALTLEGVPTTLDFRGDLYNEFDGERDDLAGWYVVIKSDGMSAPGVGELQLELDQYAQHDVEETEEPFPDALVFVQPGRARLRLTPVTGDAG